MITITFANQKGGVAKTVTACNLAAGLAQKGYRVVTIDSDPQCNLTFVSNINPLDCELTLFDMYEGTSTWENTVVYAPEYDLIPGDLRLTTADLAYAGKLGREYMLEHALKGMEEKYDYCIIDTPPQIGLLVENALICTDQVIIPLTTDAFSIQGLSNFVEIMASMKKQLPDKMKFKIQGLLITRYQKNTNSGSSLMNTIQEIGKSINTYVYKTIIGERVAVRDSSIERMSTLLARPKSQSAKEYMSFVNEYLEREGKQNG